MKFRLQSALHHNPNPNPNPNPTPTIKYSQLVTRDELTSLPNVNISRLSTLAVTLGKPTGVPRGGFKPPLI